MRRLQTQVVDLIFHLKLRTGGHCPLLIVQPAALEKQVVEVLLFAFGNIHFLADLSETCFIRKLFTCGATSTGCDDPAFTW